MKRLIKTALLIFGIAILVGVLGWRNAANGEVTKVIWLPRFANPVWERIYGGKPDNQAELVIYDLSIGKTQTHPWGTLWRCQFYHKIDRAVLQHNAPEMLVIQGVTK